MKKSYFKKSFRCVLIFLLISILSLGVFANYTDEAGASAVNESNITIDIEGYCDLTADQITRVTDMVMAYHCGHIVPTMSSTYGLTCILLGHDKQTNMVSVIEHKVRATIPRCLETKYLVTTCSRCDYENIEYVAEIHVACCD